MPYGVYNDGIKNTGNIIKTLNKLKKRGKLIL